MMVHVTEPDGSEEIIHSNEMGKNKRHVIRTHKSAKGSWSVVENNLIDESPEAKQVLTGYDTNWSYEERVEFCDRQ